MANENSIDTPRYKVKSVITRSEQSTHFCVLCGARLAKQLSQMPLSSRPGRVRQHLRETFVWRESELEIWHGVKFALDTAVPTLAGLVLGQPAWGFIGALAGSLFSFSDSTDPLSIRLLRLTEMTAAMLLAGVLGYFLGAHSPFFWGLLLSLVFGAGWLQLISHSFASPLRWGAIALVSTAGLPGATWSLAGMVVFAAIVGAATRFIGDRFFPEAAPVVPPASGIGERSRLQRVRFCAVYALAAIVALLVGQQRGLTHPMWITTTTLLVMQPDAWSSVERIIQRVLGTLLGVVAAAITVALFHSVWGLFVAITVLSYALPYAATRNYWLQTALFAWLILALYDFASLSHFNPSLLGERLLDVTLGCLIAFGAILLAFVPLPRRHLSV